MAVIIQGLTPPQCEECGMSAVHHGLERFSGRLDSLSHVIFKPLDPLVSRLAPIFDYFLNYTASPLATLCFKTGLAMRIDEPDRHASETTQVLWNEAKRRGIEMYEVRPLGLPRRYFIARHNGIAVAFEETPRPARRQKSMWWIDNKAEMKKRFLSAGFPIARGGHATSEREAIRIFNSLEPPVIVKPKTGSGGRHTTVHIETIEALHSAYQNARLIAPSVIVEEELYGPIFRATFVDKNLVAVLRRDPPRVVGNGYDTIQALVNRENENPLRRGPVFAEININSSTAKRELARQHHSPTSIPAMGQNVYFHFKVNWGVGGTSHNVTRNVHPDNQKLFENIGVYLGEDIVGIDFIIEDIAKSWRATNRCGVIECNSLPMLGNHHFPYAGPVQDVAGKVWDMAFPKTRKALA